MPPLSVARIRSATKSTGDLGFKIPEGMSKEDWENLPDAPFFTTDEELPSDEHSSDEDSDYGSSRKKGKGPPAKRAKKGSVVKQSSAKGSKQKKSLSLLPAMPLDVLFEVFSHLTPGDVINLSRTSRIFRDTLMMKNATSVWKAARERCGAPECPSNMSEPQWAVLLFGNLCQRCSAKNILKPDFALLRRLCISCKKKEYLLESKFKTRFPDIDSEILELIPYTNVGAWSHGYARSSRFFWISDIHAMMRKIAEHEHKIHLRCPGAHKDLQNFKDQQREKVASIRKSIRERESWCHQFAKGRHVNKQAAMDQRFESIKSKFIEMGYAECDVLHVRDEHECQLPALLTDRIWNRICPILEPMIHKRKMERLEREMEEIRSARRAIVNTSYQVYQRALMPSQWKYLPRTVDICAMDPFAAVVNAEVDVTVKTADFGDAFHQLPELISAYFDARKLHVRSLLKIPTSNQPALELGEIVVGEASSSSNSLRPDALDLATSVFTCLEPSCWKSCLFGWDDIAQHHCKEDLDFRPCAYWMKRSVEDKPCPPKLEFDTPKSEITAAVVRRVGLDDKVATVSDMDTKTKNIRFGCSLCPPVKRNGIWNMGGYKWREMVSHCAVKLHSPKNALTVLPPDVVAKVKESEMTNPRRSSNNWTCGHCTVYLGNLRSREIVVTHLKSVHGIGSSREPEDLFLFTRNPSRDTFEAGYLVDAPPTGTNKTILCMQCANGKPGERDRLFDVGGVRNHLSAKHKVGAAVAGVHYRAK